ncbi:hypothetical protein [Xenorhabdus griffiniae]|uniref:hypothetical protein n=1 Tax=Xenorhabdus griffiniae TaxID=351672 RepID=UPI0023596CB6|nr:hypothetical protein [Xenorhabdus griffiniae]MDC9604515.1 hypothetical protein [Xenorhabdus griffiniae]
MGNKTVLGTNIHLVLNEKQEIKVSIGTESEIQTFTDEQRKKQQKENNRKNGIPHRGSYGWRKKTNPYEINNSLTITGEISAEKGAETRSWSKELEFEFKKGKKKLGPIDSAINGINKINDILSCGHPKDKFKVANLELAYPLIDICGGYELSHSDDCSLFYKFNGEITANPLIGINLRLDVVQIFAAYYKLDEVVAMIREAGEEHEKEVKKDKNGAFYGVQLDLILSGDLKVKFGWESDDKGSWSFKKEGVLEAGFGITAETNIRGGARYYAIYGYFDASATVAAKMMVALESTEKSMELILYHDGIQASASVKYGMSVGKDEKESNGDILNEESTQNQKKTEGVEECDWVFQKPISKEESPYRISLG